MSRVEALQQEVELLNEEELRTFREWFANREADEWDRQIEADSKGGKLDRLAERALREHADGRSFEL